MNARIGWAVLTLALAALLPGCSNTLFASLPVGAVTACDPAWPGVWRRIRNDGSIPKPDDVIRISTDCKQITSTENGKPKVEQHDLQLIDTAAGQFVVDAESGTDPRTCLGNGSSHCGFYLLRYQRHGQRIDLFDADHVRVHDAIAAHAIAGYTTQTNRPQEGASGKTDATSADGKPTSTATDAGAQKPTYDNLIDGSPEQIARILAQHPEFFDSKPLISLQREGAMNPGVRP